MRLTIDKIAELDGKTCFICGRYLLNNTRRDLAYAEVHTGRPVLLRPERYYLFACPNCGKIAHKRCWYEVADKKVKRSFFRTKGWKIVCPSCGFEISGLRPNRLDWRHGYQIPGHPDSELMELYTSDVLAYKAGALFGKVGQAIDGLFKVVGLSSVTDPERNAIAAAAARVGKTLSDIAAKVFKLDIPPERRAEITALKCQNCGAPLPLPPPGEKAVVCEHCGTAHLLP
ncbi:MAG: hypothetical protein DRO73_06040 [Candidatus Thorarchaeota archaeon]|nr:MAG: hypothetical protein DRO73_06040 [Candidatus Thorarchaeota archaeon]RLI56281.1 MAG: hypothetical protein DRO93_11370 [Candidatus Thorarchaeota archaeon]